MVVPLCKQKMVSDMQSNAPITNNLLLFYPSLCEEWDWDKNSKSPKEYYPNSNRRVWWKCSKCDHQWLARVADRAKSDSGCPKCSSSKGEKLIDNYCVKNNIDFVRQYKIEDCKNKRSLPFDFAIFNNNKLQFLIEYDGIQHFEIRREFTENGFKETQINDQIKNNYCKLNNIILYRIPYWELKNIVQILDNIIYHNSLYFSV